ncbi:MAG: ATP-binding protein [Muribaculaceae bacterium]|nr:ATP-binding protein [Muribaculaceae bacterium]
MKFYNRTSEIKELQRIQQLAFSSHSRMTVITGRRRIGKTSLALEATKGNAPTVYLFISRKNEAALCAEFSSLISSELQTFIPTEIKSFRTLFQLVMETAKSRKFNLIIDEFQEFEYINPAVYSEVQNIWDQYRKQSNLNLILMGSVFSMMHKIFEGYKEPLFGRADNIIRLRGFGTETLKTIIYDYRPAFTNDELLALYAFTGGVPKYVELLCENSDLTINGMLDYMVRENSPFTDEGKNILIEEFGKDYGVYFSILSCIASGTNTQSAIESALGGISIGGQLRRLIEDYSIIARTRPLMAKEGTHAIRYDITDNFLKFWFRYFDKNQTIIEIRNFELLRQIIEADYPTFSGLMLERYFRLKMAESKQFAAIGSWWERKKGAEANEIDIVGIYADKKSALVAEVKRRQRNYNHKDFMQKVESVKHRILSGYEITTRLLTLEDM